MIYILRNDHSYMLVNIKNSLTTLNPHSFYLKFQKSFCLEFNDTCLLLYVLPRQFVNHTSYPASTSCIAIPKYIEYKSNTFYYDFGNKTIIELNIYSHKDVLTPPSTHSAEFERNE